MNQPKHSPKFDWFMTSYTQNNITLYCTANNPEQNHRVAHIHGKNPVWIPLSCHMSNNYRACSFEQQSIWNMIFRLIQN